MRPRLYNAVDCPTCRVPCLDTLVTQSAHEYEALAVQKPARPREQCRGRGGLASITSSTATWEGAHGVTIWCRAPSTLQASPTATGQACAASMLTLAFLAGRASSASSSSPSELPCTHAGAHETGKKNNNSSHPAPYGDNLKACREAEAPKGAIRKHKLVLTPGACQYRRQACFGLDTVRQGCS